MREFDDDKQFRVLLIELVDEERNQAGERTVLSYKFIRGQGRVDYQVRPGQLIDIECLRLNQCYYVYSENTSHDKRKSNWVWSRAEPITRKRALELYWVHMFFGRSNFNKPLPNVLEQCCLEFPSPREALEVWNWAKALNEGNDPGIWEVLTAAPKTEDISDNTLLFIEKTIRVWKEQRAKDKRNKDFFGDDSQ